MDYAPGMRTIIRDEEWMVKKVEKNNMGNNIKTRNEGDGFDKSIKLRNIAEDTAERMMSEASQIKIVWWRFLKKFVLCVYRQMPTG